MRLDGFRGTIAGCVFASVCLTPFLSGTVERALWIPLWQLWMGLGLVSSLLERREPGAGARTASLAVSRALLPVHALFALQLVPLPPGLLGLVSPGSFAAHFLPDPGDGRFRPISVSPGATVEAWLYVAGLQGLYLALRGLPAARRRTFVYGLLAVIGLLAVEGLWQSRSSHPYWLYGRVPLTLPSGFETAVFGPYGNRNHFATVMAIGCGLSAGLASDRARQRGGLIRLLSQPTELARPVLLSGASLFFLITSFASGSRSGALAAIVALGWVSMRMVGKAPLVAVISVGLGALALGGAAAMERLQRLDLLVSRIKPWVDMTTLFRFFPAFGSGMGAFAAAYWPYQRNARYEFWPHAHNDYLQWLIEGGVAGVLVMILVIRSLRAALKPQPDLQDAFRGALAAFAVQAAFDFPSHIPANAAVLACIMAVTTIPRREATRAPSLRP